MKYRKIEPPDDESFNRLLAIYGASIAASEQKAPDLLRAMWHRPDYHFILASPPQAFAVLFNGEDCSLLEYLAVAPEHRSGGIGSSLFHECLSRAVGPLLVEVDAPDDRDAERRIAFYRRLGCRELAGVAYQLPLPNDPPPMRLMIRAPESATSLARSTVRHYLRTIYTRVYGQSAGDARVADMVAGLPDPVRLL